MSRTRLAPLVILLALVSNACGGAKQDDAKKTAPSEADAKATDAAGEGTTGTTGTIGTTSTTGPSETETETDDEETGEPAPLPDRFDEIGVAVCDQYVKDYLACIDAKIPEAEREGHRRTIADNHASWSQTMKGGDSAAAGLQIGCRAAREQAKAATTSAGCAW